MNTDSQTYISELQNLFQENSNPKRALQQKAYMKGRFAYYGLTSPQRRMLQKTFLTKQYLPKKEIAFQICRELWLKPQRELQYFSQELVSKYQNQVDLDDIELYEWMLTQKSWWDTVDYIASNLVGNFFRKFPETQKHITQKWLASNNIWLQRSCLIFQLKYKTETDAMLLAHCIQYLKGTKEFFINKAIGWALRQYSRTNPSWVEDFVEKNPGLSNLSKKEALRLLK